MTYSIFRSLSLRLLSPVSGKPLLAIAFVIACACIAISQNTATSDNVGQPSRPLHVVNKIDNFSPEFNNHNPAATLSYFGGPVISNVQVVALFWGSGVRPVVTGQIGDFFQAITKSTYFDLISEYNTGTTSVRGNIGSNQSIGRGDFGGAYTITPSVCPNAPCDVSDAQIAAELLQQINAGNLSSPLFDSQGNVNTFYMIYFPPGISVTLGNAKSCVAGGFCGYHSATLDTLSSKQIYYGVIPDFGSGSGCDTGCGGGNEFQNICSVSSHELGETVTDPDVGFSTAWYDQSHKDKDGGGEIGDICTGEETQVAAGGSTYTVQKLWSNFESACVSEGAHPSFQMAAPGTATGAIPFNFTVTVQNPISATTDVSFVGTAHFSSTDPRATLPADYSFTTADQGTQTFAATFNTGGSQTITAVDLVNPAITGTASVTVSTTTQAPSITSANNVTFVAGTPGSFTVTSQGRPTPSITRSGALPAGLSFVDNGNGTGTLSGTPAIGTGGFYSVTFTAQNSISPNSVQPFTLIVDSAPAITNAASTAFQVGSAGSFLVTTTGLPTPTLTKTGTLPAGVSFVDKGNGTGILAGTPAAGTNGTYTITLKAHSTISPDATQTFTLTVNLAPAITSGNSATFNVGTSGSFIVTTTGSPIPSLAETGALPTGVSFVDAGNGTGKLSGTPVTGTGGTYNITFSAHSVAAPDATQNFTLTVHASPAITSANSTAFQVGTPGSFTVTTTGTPNPTVTKTGVLPTGVSLVDNGNGTATFSGTPAAGTNGSYTVTLRAHNLVSPDATQTFILTVNLAPGITSANNATFGVGTASSFTITATGAPVPSLIQSGALPTGISFIDNGNGTGVLSGKPATGTNGTYNLTIIAHNAASPDATQAFTLTVTAGISITSPNATTFTVGEAGTFTVTAPAVPTPTLSKTGALPSGVTFINNKNGTATLSGTPADGTDGTYVITIKAHNNVFPDATQTFTLKVNPAPQPPAITSVNHAIFSAGTAGAFTVTATGIPTPSLALKGTLPAGVSFSDNGDGTGTLNGTPAAGSNGTYKITFTGHNTASPDASQAFTLTVDVAPTINSANNAAFSVGSAGSFTLTATGTPTPTLTSAGALPSGVSFTNNKNGTGTLSGTPDAGTEGSYVITFRAHNSASPDATQTFTLSVTAAPSITSTIRASFTASTPNSFTVTTTGTPSPSLTEIGALPAGVFFVDNGDGTAALAGSPAAGTSGTYKISFKAHNSSSPDATQAFTLTVIAAPSITSTSSTTFTEGSDNSFTVTSTGSPTPTLSKTGPLPSGVTFSNNKDGTGTLSGIPAAGTSKTYVITLRAHNTASPDATQTFTLTVSP